MSFTLCAGVTNRTETWNGPRQRLSPSSLTSDPPAHYQLSFSIRAGREIQGKWKLRVVRPEEEHFISLFSQQILATNWTNYKVAVDIDSSLTTAETVELLFEGSPATSNFDLDNISLHNTDDDSWKEEANDRIEKLRKRNVEFNFDDVDARQLRLEVKQSSHLFPFGQAVDSPHIASCHDEGRDDDYCSYARDNFNMITDTYRSQVDQLIFEI